MTDTFTQYERGLSQLLERLGKDHPQYAEVLILQIRLQENIAQARRYGDTETNRTERAQIVDELNRLALEVTGESFNELYNSPDPETKTQHGKIISNKVALDQLLEQVEAGYPKAAPEIK